MKKVAEQPSYFLTSYHNSFRTAIPIYETVIEEEALTHFTPSREAIDYGFFTKEETEKLWTYPSIQEFVKIFSPTNH
ncbi:MAG: hypothetical protein LBG52_09030 [Candidatus Peribacteria bacterium]|nr:hypothetical protein [Candidatus Peribacteria bacterium]